MFLKLENTAVLDNLTIIWVNVLVFIGHVQTLLLTLFSWFVYNTHDAQLLLLWRGIQLQVPNQCCSCRSREFI